MDLNVMLPIIAGVMLAGMFVYGIWSYVISDMIKKRKGVLIRIFLSEKIGNDLLYIGQRIGEEKKDDKIGSFIYVRKEKIPLERIGSSDFMQDKVYTKALHVVKYAPDDYRPLSRLKEGEWFKRETRVVKIQEQVPDPDNPNDFMVVEKEKLDDNGLPEMETVNINYKEPIGITKDDRSAMRFNLEYNKRMDEKYAIKIDGWKQLAQYVVPAFAILIVFMGFVHMTNKDTERATLFYETTHMENLEFYDKVDSGGGFVQGLIDKVEQKGKEADAPPK